MKVFYLKPDSSYSLEPSVCAIGYFDGSFGASTTVKTCWKNCPSEEHEKGSNDIFLSS